MKFLVVASADFDDENLVLVVVQSMPAIQHGEVVTLVGIEGNSVTPILQRLATEGTDDGLEFELFDGRWSTIDFIDALFQEGHDATHAKAVLANARKNLVPSLAHYDTLSR